MLTRFAPEVQHQLSNIQRTLTETLNKINERQSNANQSQQHMQQLFSDIISGKQQLQLSVKLDSNNTSQAVAVASAISSSTPTQEMSANEQDTINTSSINMSSPSIDLTTPDTTATTTTTIAVVSLPFTNDGVAVYKMSRQVVTVSDLWDEWKIGRDGFWSVEELEKKWGTKWRRNDRKWFNIRKKVIEAVEDLRRDLGLSVPSAIGVLQKAMNTRYWSLDRMGTELQKGTYFPCQETKRRKLQ